MNMLTEMILHPLKLSLKEAIKPYYKTKIIYIYEGEKTILTTT